MPEDTVDAVATTKTTHELGEQDRRDVREGITLLIDAYEVIEKKAEKVTDFHIKAEAHNRIERLISLRNRFADPGKPKLQLELGETSDDEEEPEVRPLHLQFRDLGYALTEKDVEGWDEAERAGVMAWLEAGADPDAEPAVLTSAPRIEDGTEPEDPEALDED